MSECCRDRRRWCSCSSAGVAWPGPACGAVRPGRPRRRRGRGHRHVRPLDRRTATGRATPATRAARAIPRSPRSPRRTSRTSRSPGGSRPTASGTRPEYKLEGTPLVVNGILYTTAGTRRSVICAGCRDRRAAVGAPLSGRHARRQRAAAALGPRPRLLDRRPGRRAHHLLHARLPDDRARREDRAAGQDVRQGRRRRSEGRRRVRQRPAD